jgi:3-oxoacyl-[acyl-carrier-protein] synthase II
MDLCRVVITGMGAVTPIGNNLDTYWNGLINGKNGADFITRFNAANHKTKFACEVKNLDFSSIIEKKEFKRLDLFSQFAIIASEEAILDANLLNESIDKDRVGVIWASGIGGIQSYQENILDFADNNQVPRFSPFFIPKMIIDIAAGHISIRHGFRGVNYAVVSACASSSHAIIDAYTHIQLGRADAIVVGGSEATITESSLGGFNSLKALSERNDDPKTASRPFDKHRDGFVMGEGGGCMILETEEHALKRGAKILGEVVGVGMSADAYHITAPHPEGLGAQLVMKNALKDAGLNPAQIDYINVHGTSTELGDVSELNAILKTFGEDAYKLNISSTKSMTGHLLGAAGIIEAIASVMAIQEQIIPPTINHFEDDPEIDSKLNLTFHNPVKRKVEYAMSNTFGFGGHNASVIFKKYTG